MLEVQKIFWGLKNTEILVYFDSSTIIIPDLILGTKMFGKIDQEIGLFKKEIDTSFIAKISNNQKLPQNKFATRIRYEINSTQSKREGVKNLCGSFDSFENIFLNGFSELLKEAKNVMKNERNVNENSNIIFDCIIQANIETIPIEVDFVCVPNTCSTSFISKNYWNNCQYAWISLTNFLVIKSIQFSKIKTRA
jgi:hypothetical protein